MKWGNFDFVKIAGIAFGSLSMLLMASNGLDLTLGPNAARLLQIAAWIFGIFGPLIDVAQPIVDRIREAIHPLPDLQPEWRYVFALSGLYFFKNVPQFYRSYRDEIDLPPDVRRNCLIMAGIATVLGTIVAFLIGILCGMIPLQLQHPTISLYAIELPSELFFVSVPVVGFLFYTITFALFEAAFHRDVIAIKLQRPIELPARFLMRRAGTAGVVSIAGLALGTALLSLDWIQSFKSPHLFVLAILMISLAIYWLIRAFNQANGDWKRMRKLGNYSLGLDMLAVVFWSVALYGILYGVG